MKWLQVRISQELNDRLDSVPNKSKLVRNCLYAYLGKIEQPLTDDNYRELKKICRDLHGVGSNINQHLKRINQSEDENLKAESAELQKLYTSIRSTISQINKVISKWDI